MQDFDMEWVEELKRQTVNHMMYEPFEKVCRRLEPEFQQIVGELSLEKQQFIMHYMNMMEKKNVQLTMQGYLMGIQVGERRWKKQR